MNIGWLSNSDRSEGGVKEVVGRCMLTDRAWLTHGFYEWGNDVCVGGAGVVKMHYVNSGLLCIPLICLV